MGHPCVTLPIDQWPRKDHQLWVAAMAPGDALEPGGAGSPWTEKTRRQVAKDYGRFLYWLQKEGQLDPEEDAVSRLSKVRLETYFLHLQQTGMATTSLYSRIRTLQQAFRVLSPQTDHTALRTLCAKLKHRAVPTRQKHTRMVDPALIIDRSLAHYDELVALGGPFSPRTCTRARDALMFAFLAYHPIRLANFASLRVGQHLLPLGQGMRLKLAAAETKEHRPYECLIDQDLQLYLNHYLSVIRPALLAGFSSDFLWAYRFGGLCESSIYYQITSISRRLIGWPINPHLIRDCVMTGLAEHAPEDIHVGSQVLGHRDLRTGELHYNHANAVSAKRVHFEIVRAHREGIASDVG